MVFIRHCVADVSLRDSSEVTGASLHAPLSLPQLGIAFHSPPVGAAEFYVWLLAMWWFSFKLMSGEDPMIYHCFSEPTSNIKIRLVGYDVGYDGFCQKHETLCVGCHKYFTIADLLGGVCRPAARSSNSAVRATTAKILMLLNESPFYYSFL